MPPSDGSPVNSQFVETKPAEQIKKAEDSSVLFSNRLALINLLLTTLLGFATLYISQRSSSADRQLKKDADGQTLSIEALKLRSATEIETQKERLTKADLIYRIFSPLAKTPEEQRALAKDMLAPDPDQQKILNDLSAASQSPHTQDGHKLAVKHPSQSPYSQDAHKVAEEHTRWPLYVDRKMIIECVTRGGKDQCAGDSIKLGGTEYTRGVVFTQSFPQAATATIQIPEGARSFSFIVGDYWTGGDCGGQKPMEMSIFVDGKPAPWGPLNVSSIRTNSIQLPPKARFLTLRGDSGDGDTRCDSSVWVNTRFE